MLVLDFDGVVCDAFAECAAVSWHASRAATGSAPPLPGAVSELPGAYLATFASVRAYSRTLDDFMVANAVPAGLQVDRDEFERARTEAGPARLAAQAVEGERIRSFWRDNQYDAWISLHTVYREVAELLATTSERIVIVSAKDEQSIWAVLESHQLAGRVDTVIGSCADKAAVLAGLLTADAADPASIVFVDDNLQNALAAAAVPGVHARWATWGYHGPEDAAKAQSCGITSLTLSELAASFSA